MPQVYIAIQKDIFFDINAVLSGFPDWMHNLTQLGDVLVSFALLSIFIIYAPKLWEALITGAFFSLWVSAALKRIFAVPRPAAMFSHDSFSIIGRTLSGNTSLPSGHAMATFVVLTVLFYAFMPKLKERKIVWFFAIFIAGFLVAISRVGVGAHYPLDVLIGGVTGYVIAVLGIVLVAKYRFLHWVGNVNYYPVFMVLLLFSAWLLFRKLIKANLPVFYISLFALIVSLYFIINTYVKKN